MIAPADSTFDAYLSEGRFMIQRSSSTGAHVFPPRVALPGEGRSDLEWVEANGRATVHSFTLVPQRAPESDYNVCLVDLVEGPRLMTRLVDIDPADIDIGLEVEARILEADGGRHLVFAPVNA